MKDLFLQLSLGMHIGKFSRAFRKARPQSIVIHLKPGPDLNAYTLSRLSAHE